MKMISVSQIVIDLEKSPLKDNLSSVELFYQHENCKSLKGVVY